MHSLVLLTALSATTGLFGGGHGKAKNCGRPAARGHYASAPVSYYQPQPGCGTAPVAYYAPPAPMGPAPQMMAPAPQDGGPADRVFRLSILLRCPRRSRRAPAVAAPDVDEESGLDPMTTHE